MHIISPFINSSAYAVVMTAVVMTDIATHLYQFIYTTKNYSFVRHPTIWIMWVAWVAWS